MPQGKKKVAKKPAAKKPATKRKPAAKKPPEPKVQVNRVTETPTAPDDSQTEEQRQAEQDQLNDQAANQEPESDESQEERDAAGEARRERVLTPGRHGKEVVPDYEPDRLELEHKDFDHHSAEEKRQAELAAARDEHNERTGDGSRKGTWS